jgi:hypothetical protein
MTTSPSSPLRWPRLPARATPVVFAFYMSAIMAMLMSGVIVGAQQQLDADLPAKVLHAYTLAMPTAFVCVLVVRPVVMWLVRRTVREA